MTDLRRAISGLIVGLWLVFLLIHSSGSHAGSPCWTFIPQNESYIITCPGNEVLAPRQINSGPLNFEYIGQKAWELKTSHFQFPDLQYFQQSVPNFINNMQCIQSYHIDKFCPSEHESPNFYTGGHGCGLLSGCNSTESDLACPYGGCNITIEGGSGTRIYTQVYILYSQYQPYPQDNIVYLNYSTHIYRKAVITIPQGLRKPRFIIGYEISDYHDKRISPWIHAECWQRKGLVDASDQPAHGCVSGPDSESVSIAAVTHPTSDESKPVPSTQQMVMNSGSQGNSQGLPAASEDAPADFPTNIAIICGVIFVVAFIVSIVVVIQVRRKCRKNNHGKKTNDKKEVGQDEDQPGKYENLQNFSAENTKVHVYSQMNILNEDSSKVNHEGEDDHEYEEITDLGNTNDRHIDGASNGQRTNPSCSKSAFQDGHQYENVKPSQKGAVKKVQMYENIA